MQTQRLILWMVFSMSLLMLWDGWQRHNGRASMFGGAPTAETATGGARPANGGAPGAGTGGKADPSVPSAVPGAVTSADVPAGGVVPGAAPASAAPAAQPIRLKNDVFAIEVDPQGGQVVKTELLTHTDAERPELPVTLLSNAPGKIYLAQSGLIGAPAGASFPTHRTPMQVADGPRELAAGADTVAVVLTGESGGLKLERTIAIRRGSYLVTMTDRITNTGTGPLAPTLYRQLARDTHKPAGESQFYSTYTGPVVFTDKDKFQKVAFDDIEKGKPKLTPSANDGWVGVIQHYFVAAWVPPEKTPREFFASKIDSNFYSIGFKQPLGEIAPGASQVVESKLYVGPQDQDTLARIAPGLDLVVDYGWLTFIAKPIFWLLQQLHKLVNNWGWAIVLLTIVIKTAFFPLQAASYKSMARMKAVTPRLTALRERYGNDRVKMNQAMMELYKEEKINPLGGCLPIVVQIPVFIALYWVLLASVEMRNAPWLGWIKDLAAPDPFYILPLVMAGTMFFQVKLNPTPPDPVQAKMMTIMPLVFSVMFFFFPAGLVLYWLVNNVYSIAQQWYINTHMDASKAKPKKT